MSNQLRLPARRAFVRAPGVIGYYPCFQASGNNAMIDRSGAGNNAAIGADASLSTMWIGTANRYSIVADDGSGTTAKAAAIPAATIGWSRDADTLLIAGIWSGANTATRYICGMGGNSGTTIHGWGVRSNTGTGKAKLYCVHSGGTMLGNDSTLTVGDGTDHAVAIVIDGSAKRAHLYIDGVYDASNSGVGLDWSSIAANITALGPLVIGGYPHTAGKQLVWASTSYAWQVARRTGGVPSNIAQVIARLARSPLQVLTSTEWPA